MPFLLLMNCPFLKWSAQSKILRTSYALACTCHVDLAGVISFLTVKEKISVNIEFFGFSSLCEVRFINISGTRKKIISFKQFFYTLKHISSRFQRISSKQKLLWPNFLAQKITIFSGLSAIFLQHGN